MRPDTPFVAAIGGANIDIHGHSSGPLIERDSNPGNVRLAPGGVARNVAENLARLGVGVRFISAVGKDDHGELLLRLGREAGIDMEHVQQIDSVPTSTYLSVVDDSGDMYVAVSDMNIIDQFDAARLQASQDMLRKASLLVLDANLPDNVLAWLTTTFSDRPLFIDTVSTTKAVRIRPYLGAIHTLKTSRAEAEALTGLDAATESQLCEIAQSFHALGVERLFVTLGDQGVFFSANDEQSVIGPTSTVPDISNTGGAGDAFLAGLVYAWLEAWELDKSVQFALAAAAVTLACGGTNNPDLSLATITALLESDHG